MGAFLMTRGSSQEAVFHAETQEGWGSTGEGCQFSPATPAMGWRTEAPAHVHAYAVSPSLLCCPPSSPPDPSSASSHWLQKNPQPSSPLPETPLLPAETLLQVSPEHT